MFRTTAQHRHRIEALERQVAQLQVERVAREAAWADVEDRALRLLKRLETRLGRAESRQDAPKPTNGSGPTLWDLKHGRRD